VCTESKFKGGIIWCYNEENAVPTEHLKELKKKISYHKGVPDDQFLENSHGKSTLVILDDLLNKAYSKQVRDLFTRGSHHRNISVFLLTQNLFLKNEHSRDISLNTKYIVVVKSLRDKSQFSFLARQIYPEDSISLYESYLDATENPHGYLVLDLAQNSNNLTRFRTHIFPDEDPLIVYAPIGNETKKVKL
jgi:hypothetical protein